MPVNAKYVHTNIVARDWAALADFYQQVFGCTPVPPERDLRGEAFQSLTGLSGAEARGVHLRLPGHGDSGPTLEIFQYNQLAARPSTAINRPGLAHLAFEVDDLAAATDAVLNAGGGKLGQRVTIPIGGQGTIHVAYLTDPEGNIVELQRWEADSAPDAAESAPAAQAQASLPDLDEFDSYALSLMDFDSSQVVLPGEVEQPAPASEDPTEDIPAASLDWDLPLEVAYPLVADGSSDIQTPASTTADPPSAELPNADGEVPLPPVEATSPAGPGIASPSSPAAVNPPSTLPSASVPPGGAPADSNTPATTVAAGGTAGPLRLTLRTLLAYRDRQLGPAELEEIGRKLSEQPYANRLLQRVNSLVANPLVKAPRIKPKQAVFDANLVAAYLDMSLDQQHVAAYEQACLNSERGLAEAAGCHEVLVRILGSPVSISEELRKRVHGLRFQRYESTSAPEKFTWFDDSGNFYQIRFYCRQCRGLLSVARRKIGQQVACPKCAAQVTVPEEDELAPRTASPDDPFPEFDDA